MALAAVATIGRGAIRAVRGARRARRRGAATAIVHTIANRILGRFAFWTACWFWFFKLIVFGLFLAGMALEVAVGYVGDTALGQVLSYPLSFIVSEESQHVGLMLVGASLGMTLLFNTVACLICGLLFQLAGSKPFEGGKLVGLGFAWVIDSTAFIGGISPGLIIWCLFMLFFGDKK